MRDFFLANGGVITAVLAVLEAILTVILFADAARKKSMPVLLTALISLGLTIDAAVMALGNVIPADILPVCSRVRFVAHGLLVPLMLALCGYVLRWAHTKKQTVLWCITLIVCVLGAASGFARVLELSDTAHILRHAASDATPMWAQKVNRLLSFGTVLPLIAAGIGVMVKEKNPWIFLSGLLMFVFAALGPATGNTDLIFLISMFGELLMAVCFLIYEKIAIRTE